jgi:hypothetical protein
MRKRRRVAESQQASEHFQEKRVPVFLEARGTKESEYFSVSMKHEML